MCKEVSRSGLFGREPIADALLGQQVAGLGRDRLRSCVAGRAMKTRR